jgi:hypothetical protein
MVAQLAGWRFATAVALAVSMPGIGPAAAQTPADPASHGAAASECADVIVLAVPGTWETNAKADRNVVPGMLANVTGPLLRQLDAAPPEEGASAQSTTTSAAPTTTLPTQTQLPYPSLSPDPSSTQASVRAEQVPYVAQVGGPIAGMLTGNPLTLSQSRANGTSALETRMTELAQKCPLSKFVILGYSQGALIAGDELSKIGNRQANIDPSRILAGALLSDPRRSPSTPDPTSGDTVDEPEKQSAASETMIGPNVGGEGVLGPRDGGMGVLAERVTTMCAPHDSICSLSDKSKIVAAIVPLLNLTPGDIPDYLIGKGEELVRHVAGAPPELIVQAATSVISELTKIGIAAATAPQTLPVELAQMVFSSTMLDDIANVVRMPELDALVSLTHPEELIQQVTQVGATLLLDAHRSYASYKVDPAGDSATAWIVKWLTSKIQAGL